MNGDFSIDALLPPDMAQKAETIGVKKANMPAGRLLLLAILAGAFIALGAIFATTVSVSGVTVKDAAGAVISTSSVAYGLTRLVMGLAFSLGLILVIVGGAELFTGNCMMPLGTLSGCAPLSGVLRNWFWVYIANFIGSILVAVIIYLSGLATGPVGANALKIAAAKMSLPMDQAFFRAILCNWLVVLAVWMSMAATDIIGKIFAIFFPIMAFVASGFEHSIANMYFMALGILVKGNPEVVATAHLDPGKLDAVSLGGYFHNLIPVTLGNMVGGILFVAVAYFLVFKNKLIATD